MADLAPGTKLTETLTLLRVLGEGGMGKVWLAEHRALGGEVAVKVLHADLVRRDPSLLARFAAEARAAAKVRHPHIVQVLDCGTTPDGVSWLSMERLVGRNLREVVESEKRSPPFALDVVAQVASALANAHAVGVVHRDLKPENLFVTSVGGKPFVKVLDFGIAKVTDEGGGKTATGAVFGTPAYMSLEQLQSTKNVDAQADLWALAVVAYELLTGRLPFDGETSSAIVLAVGRGECTAASSLVAGLGPAVDAFFARAFARDPAARFASVEEFAMAFAAALPAVSAYARTDPQLVAACLPADVLDKTDSLGARDGVTPSAASSPRPSGVSRRAAVALGGVAVMLMLALGLAKLRESSSTREGVASAAALGVGGAKCKPGMAFIPSGTFTMGDDENRAKAGKVTVAEFCMDLTEVTTSAYLACVKAGKCTAPTQGGFCNAGVPDRENHPINCVDWTQAKDFCVAKGLRLPTDEEWEYAARGTDGRLFPWGNEPPSDQLCWKRLPKSSCAVGAYPKGNSPFGLADMSGNVWEWTASKASPRSADRDYRGGAWCVDVPSFVRSAYRHSNGFSSQDDSLGFRCAGSAALP